LISDVVQVDQRVDHVRRKARVDLLRERRVDQNTLHAIVLVRSTIKLDYSHYMRGEDACRLDVFAKLN
jgi:acyl-CoA thioesterase FadM